MLTIFFTIVLTYHLPTLHLIYLNNDIKFKGSLHLQPYLNNIVIQLVFWNKKSVNEIVTCLICFILNFIHYITFLIWGQNKYTIYWFFLVIVSYVFLGGGLYTETYFLLTETTETCFRQQEVLLPHSYIIIWIVWEMKQ